MRYIHLNQMQLNYRFPHLGYQKQHLELLQEYKLAEPAKSQAETQNQSKSLERVVQLKAAISRAERDMDSLQRELSRYPLTAKGATP